MSDILFLDRLLAVAALLHDDQERELGRQGLTTARTHLLWELQHRGASTQVQLADALGVTPRNITALVDALIDTGFVTRTPHPRDRRAVLVELTATGSTTMTTMVREHRALDEALVAGLDRQTLVATTAALDHVYGRLEELIATHRATESRHPDDS